MICPVCGEETKPPGWVHTDCRAEIPAVAKDLRETIIAATTTRLSPSARLIRQPAPGWTWERLMAERRR